MHWDLKMMDENQKADQALEALFDAAWQAPPEVPDALMARVLADARSAQVAPSFWTGLMESLGGWPGLGGLVTATCVGVWIGVAPPARVPDLAGQVLGLEPVAETNWEAVGLTDFGWDIEEG